MNRKHYFLTLFVLIVIALMVMAFFITTKRMYPEEGVIAFPKYQTTSIMNKTRDMVYDLGWTQEMESGGGGEVMFLAKDKQGGLIKFIFKFEFLRAEVTITPDDNAASSTEEITQELARRIGMKVDGEL